MSTILQYCNEVHYVNSGQSGGGGGASRPPCPPLPTPMPFIMCVYAEFHVPTCVDFSMLIRVYTTLYSSLGTFKKCWNECGKICSFFSFFFACNVPSELKRVVFLLGRITL